MPPLCSAVAVGGRGHVCSGEKGSAGPEWRMNEMGILCCFCPQREMGAGGAWGLFLLVEFCRGGRTAAEVSCSYTR